MKLAVIAAILAATVSTSHAETVTCRDYSKWTVGERDAFMMGFIDGVISGMVEADPSHASAWAEKSKFLAPDSTRTSPDDIRKAVDALCSDPANFALPLSGPVEVAVMRIRGASPQTIETRLADLRRVIASLPAK